MTRSKARRARLGSLLAVALGAIAMLALPGVAAAKDRNHDHIPDRWEKRHKLSLKVNQAHKDQDRDKLNNLGEFKAGDNPQNPDSNGNGIEDGEEHAGTIASFDPATGKLVINLFGGEAVTGLVTEQTEIECGSSHGEGEEAAPTVAMHEDGGEQSGDSHGGESADDSQDGEAGSDDSPGHDGTEHEGGQSGNCTTADLVAGAEVDEAELDLANGVATFTKVELGGTSGS